MLTRDQIRAAARFLSQTGDIAGVLGGEDYRDELRNKRRLVVTSKKKNIKKKAGAKKNKRNGK